MIFTDVIMARTTRFVIRMGDRLAVFRMGRLWGRIVSWTAQIAPVHPERGKPWLNRGIRRMPVVFVLGVPKGLVHRGMVQPVEEQAKHRFV